VALRPLLPNKRNRPSAVNLNTRAGTKAGVGARFMGDKLLANLEAGGADPRLRAVRGDTASASACSGLRPS